MYHISGHLFFCRFRKSLSLRVVNWLGLSVMFACLLLSYSYIKRELSYDRHHVNADRIVRLSMQFNDEPVDGRILGNAIDHVLRQMPEVDRMVKMFNVYSAVLTYQGKPHAVNDFYAVSRDFLQVFDLPLLYGDKDNALQQRGQAIISESFARQLFGELNFDEIQMPGISLGEQKLDEPNVFITGIFKDIPETSHFHADIFVHLRDGHEGYTYTYLLLKNQTDIPMLARKITELSEDKEWYQQSKPRALLMPLTDIHLHSRNLREMEVNGNINYIYLVAGANLLLLVVVLFNLWLNASLIFAHSRRYYQMLRMNGASANAVLWDEALIAVLLGVISILAGMLAARAVSSAGYFPFGIAPAEVALWCASFLALTVTVSVLPAVKNMSTTLFRNTQFDLRPVRFSHTGVRYMLTAQYAVVMVVVILAFGITRQMNMVKDTQAGGDERSILVLNEQPDDVQAKYALLKTELLKHPAIEMVTSSFQLPGDAIRDAVQVRREDDTDWQRLPLMVVGEDFLPFFHIKTIAGNGFSPARHDFDTEWKMLLDRVNKGIATDIPEEYIVNRKALAVLGFAAPEEAIGQPLRISQGTVDYFNRGTIVGVTDDFNYTGLHEPAIPMLIMQRQVLRHCIMVRFDPAQAQQAQAAFRQVWHEIHPGYTAGYTFMSDVFGRIYRNELNADRLVYVFSALCLIVASLGLVIFMAFIIRRRTREVAIRKVHGAGIGDILVLLNANFIRSIALAFAVAVPAAWYVMHRWLEHFAYRISLSWWIFALAGVSVLALSLALVSLQSWRAAKANPLEAIKNE
jgi:putative ABC transport system permease protein